MDAPRDAHADPGPDPEAAPHPDHEGGDDHGVHLGQQDIRAAKLAARRAAGETEPYRWPVDHALADIRAAHPDLPPDTVVELRPGTCDRCRHPLTGDDPEPLPHGWGRAGQLAIGNRANKQEGGRPSRPPS